MANRKEDGSRQVEEGDHSRDPSEPTEMILMPCKKVLGKALKKVILWKTLHRTQLDHDRLLDWQTGRKLSSTSALDVDGLDFTNGYSANSSAGWLCLP